MICGYLFAFDHLNIFLNFILIALTSYLYYSIKIYVSDYKLKYKECDHNVKGAYKNPELCQRCIDEEKEKVELKIKLNGLDEIKRDIIEKNKKIQEDANHKMVNKLKSKLNFKKDESLSLKKKLKFI